MARKMRDITAMPAHPQNDSRLCNFAPELRTRVWEYTFSVEPDARGTVYIARHCPPQQTHSVLRLLETCRLIHNEAAGIFYHMHQLRMRSTRLNDSREPEQWQPASIKDFHGLTQLSQPRIANIRHLTFDLPDHRQFWTEILTSVLKALRHLPRLEAMTFTMPDGLSITRPWLSLLEGKSGELSRELPLCRKAVGKLTSVKLLKFEYYHEQQTQIEMAHAIDSFVQEIISAMPYVKAAKAAAAVAVAGKVVVEEE